MLFKKKTVYVAIALNPDGEKDVLGLWIEQSEGAKFWLKVWEPAWKIVSRLTNQNPDVGYGLDEMR